MNQALLITCAAITGCASSARAPSPPQAPAIDSAAAWHLLASSLPGTWRLEPTTGSTRPSFLVRYHLISNASALVEDWGVDGPRPTETVFYPDHARLLETHFCAQGNQPRLAATERAADSVRFQFVDVTNRAPDQDMLTDRTLRLSADTSALDIVETYRTAAGRDDVTTYHFTRNQ